MAEKKYEKEVHFCPYCDAEIGEASFPYCEACKVTVFICPECGKSLARNKRKCPSCGADIRKSAQKGK